MNLTYVVLLALLIVYIPLFFYVKKSEKAHEKGFVPYGPLIMIKTKMGIKFMDRLGKYKRFWRAFGFVSKLISLFLMIYIVAILIIDICMLPSVISRGGGGMGIEYALAIPGINPMLPLVYGWIGLIIAMVVHELAHGMQTKANDMDVDSTGVLYGVVPLGAFVEPSEEQVEKSSRRAKMDLYAAGITTNFIVAMVLFIVMFASLSGGVTSTYGDSPAISGITASSPGLDYGIPSTSVIISVNGIDVDSMDDLNSIVNHYGEYTLVYDTKDVKGLEKTVTLGTYINKVVSSSPAEGNGIKTNTYLVSIESNGITTEFGLASSFTDFMSTTKGGQIVTITTTSLDGTTYVHDPIALRDNNGIGYLGISTTTSGFAFTTPNKVLSVAMNPFYGCDTVSEYAMGAISYLGTAFSGYSPVPEATQWWFDSNILPDNIFWIFMSLVYWTFWLNLVLGVSNALPGVPFDGGFLFIGGFEFLLEKLGIKDEKKKEKIVNVGSSIMTYVTIATLLLVILIVVI